MNSKKECLQQLLTFQCRLLKCSNVFIHALVIKEHRDVISLRSQLNINILLAQFKVLNVSHMFQPLIDPSKYDSISVRDYIIDNGRFDRCQTLNWKKVPNPHSAVDPRDTPEVYYWGCGFLESLTIVVEEDATSDEVTSTDGSEPEVAESDTAATDSEEEETPIKVKKVLFAATDIRFR